MTNDRLTKARAAVFEIVGDTECLMFVLDDRMAARGFDKEEASEALDSIARERMVFIRRFAHPVLGGQLVVSFTRGR